MGAAGLTPGKHERGSEAVSKYAVYTTARIYHPMRDEKHTVCGIPVFESNSGIHYQSGGAMLKIVESIPEGLQLCPHCAAEGSLKKGGKR